MKLRLRWILISLLLLANTVAAAAAEKWVGAGICGGMVLSIWAVGLVEVALLNRVPQHDSLGADAPEVAVEALRELVALKDGPRDAAYEKAKPLAWQRARQALSALDADRPKGDGQGVKYVRRHRVLALAGIAALVGIGLAALRASFLEVCGAVAILAMLGLPWASLATSKTKG